MNMAVNHPQNISSSGTPMLNLISFNYQWYIHHFSYYEEKSNDRLLSPTFSMGKNDEYKWQLQSDLNGYGVEDVGHLSLCLHCKLCEEEAVRAKVTLSVVGYEKVPAVSTKPIIWKFNRVCPSMRLKRFIRRDHLLDCKSGYLRSDTVRIDCYITVIESAVNTEVKRDLKGLKVPECQLLSDVRNLYESSELCDFTLIACGREFPVHKVILAARSPVFSAMFKHDMEEQQQNRVNIGDVDDEVLQEMLRFIYTGEAANLEKVSTGLLAAANKYQLERLKYICEKELCESLAIENAASRLILGDVYNAAHLKEQAIKFICKHTAEVMATDTYNSMHSTHPHLIDEVFLIAATKKIDLNA